MKHVKWGLIGCGDIAKRRVAPAIVDLEQNELMAISRQNKKRLGEFAEEFMVPKIHNKWQELVKDPDINAVYVATPVYLHAPMTLAAAEAGKHILCEKPMALTVNECEKMIQACRTNRVQLGIAYYRHYYPVLERVKDILKSGEIGEIIYVTMTIFSYFNPEPDAPRAWLNVKAKAGGGPLYDIGSHRAEVFHHLFGLPASVHGITSTQAFKRDVEDTATAIYQYKKGFHVILNVTHAAKEKQDTLDIYGSEGSVHIPDLNLGNLHFWSPHEKREESHPPHTNLHQPLIEAFSTALIEKRPFAVNGEVGRDVNLMLEEVYKSSDG